MRRWLLAAAMLTAAACDDISISMNDGGDANSANQAASASGRKDLPRPGRYAVSIIPQFIGDAPPMTGGPLSPQNTEICYSASTTPESMFAASDGGCQQDDFRAERGEIHGNMVCDFGNGPISTELHGSYDTEGAELVSDVTYPEGTIRMNRTIKRVGDC